MEIGACQGAAWSRAQGLLRKVHKSLPEEFESEGGAMCDALKPTGQVSIAVAADAVPEDEA